MLKQLNKDMKKLVRKFNRVPLKTKMLAAFVLLSIATTMVVFGPEDSLGRIRLEDALPLISGYDGVVAEISSISHPEYPDAIVTNNYTHASVDPVAMQFGDPTATKIEIQSSVNVLSSEEIDRIYRVDEDANNYYEKEWVIQKVKCSMGITILSAPDGLAAAKDLTFTIHLQENAFSIFQGANETFAFFLMVYTRTATVSEGLGTIDVTPESGGFTFAMDKVSTEPVPNWLTDSGYDTSDLQGLDEVEFNVVVNNIQPEVVALFWRGGEIQSTFYIGIDVFLAGQWEMVHDRLEWDPPDADLPWWEDIINSIKEIGVTVLIPVAVMAVAGVLIVRMFLSGGRKK